MPSLQGPWHEADYYYMDDNGNFVLTRHSFPACLSRRSNWFSEAKKLYPFTISGSVEVCFIFCTDIVSTLPTLRPV